MLIVLLGLCLFGMIKNSQKTAESYTYSDEYVMTKELPVLFDFCFFSEKEWEKKLDEQNFGEVVTWDMLDWLLEQTGSKQYISYDDKNRNVPLSREAWNQIYIQMLDLLDTENKVQIVNEVVLEKTDKKIVGGTGEYESRTDISFVLPMSACQFYVYEEKIIGIRSLKSEEAKLSNVYIYEADINEIQFLAAGKKYALALAIEQPEQIKNHVCDLLWKDGVIAKVQLKEDTIQGNLIAVDDNRIEIEGYGQIQRSENLPVYKTYGTVEEKALSDIVIANMKVEYVVAEERVEAILLLEPAKISRIRVLLLAEDGGKYRPEIYVCGNTEIKVTQKKQSIKQSAGNILKGGDVFAQTTENRIRIKPTGEGELFLCDENGNKISKGYKGTLELYRYPEGYTVVNQLSLEEYLCAVVPSEMPASYEMEALKAQAICARSYAYIQLGRGDYAAFGAHIDDSTNYQVYNKQDRDEKTTAAVWDTAGKVISYGGNTAEAYYFSTSAGITGNGDCWNLTANPDYGYLKSTLVRENGGVIDLSNEENFKNFIMQPDANAYEANLPYYRWTAAANYTSEECQQKIFDFLQARKAKTPADIWYTDALGQSVEEIKNFGMLQNISVTNRSTCGAILQLTLTYENGKVFVGNEYSIRTILAAGLKGLTLADGSNKEGVALLPSAFCILAPAENGDYSISGGGYGHGIGMSQNGASAMAAAGKSCEEILQFFYQNMEITDISNLGN